MSAEEIWEAGMRALLRDLGPVGFVRFMQQFETSGATRSSGTAGAESDTAALVHGIRAARQPGDE